MSRDPANRFKAHSGPGAATQPVTQRIFLVEDSPEDREVSRRYLTGDPDFRFVLDQYGTGQKALAAYATERPDCIMLDYQLPDMTGLTFLAQLRDLSGGKPPCAVVMLTGSGDESVAVQTLKAGAQDYLVKDTLTPEGLRRTVRSAIEKVALTHALEEQSRALAASEQRFRGIVQTAHEGIWLVDREGRTQYANERLAQLLGYPVESLERRSVAEFCFPEDIPAVQERIARNLAGSAEQFEFRFRQRNGAEVHVLASTSPMLDPEGAVAGALGLFTDITERRRQEERLRDTLALLDTIVDTAPVGFAFLDLDLRFRRVNRLLAEINGLSPQDHIGKTIREVIPSLDQVVNARLWEVLRSGKPLINLELTGMTRHQPDVMKHWLESFSPVRDPEGTILGVAVFVVDISERRRLERQTRAALDALLAMARALVSPDLAMPARNQAAHSAGECATQGSIQEAPLRRLLELAKDVLNADGVGFLAVQGDEQRQEYTLHPIALMGYAPNLERQWQATVEGMRLHERLGDEATMRLLAGEVVPHLPPASPLGRQPMLFSPVLRGDEIIGLLRIDYGEASREFTADEISLAGAVGSLLAVVLERERLLTQAAEAHGRELALQETTRRMDEFLSIAGHEMRTPITSIKSTVQLAERQLRTLNGASGATAGLDGELATRIARIERQLERADRQADRLDRLVQDLLDVSRIQEGQLEMRPEPADLAILVADAVEEQRLAHPDRDIRLDLSEAESAPIVVDPDRIAQVLTNYLTNALKYSPPAAPIAVRLERGGDFARVSVSDEGSGIPLEEQQRVWERFHRVADTAHQGYGIGAGLGLGLYICRTIVERHGGVVGVKSDLGSGSTFWFDLPVARGS